MSPAPDIARIRHATSAELAQIVADELPGPGWVWVKELRDEAQKYYFTDTAEARRIGERAVEVAELIGQPEALGWGLRAMAESLLYSGRIREADEYYDRATAAWRQNKDPRALGQLLTGRIAVLFLLGHHDRIPAIAEEARGYLVEAGDNEYLAKLAINLGNAHFQRDAYGPALAEYDAALEIFQQMKARDELVLSVEINRAVALTHLHQDQEGLALYRRLETEAGEAGFELLQAQIRMNAAHVQAQRAEFEDALRGLPQATHYFRQTNHPAFLAACLLNRAEIYHQLNLHSSALELTEEAVRLFAEEGLTYDEALALSQSALTHLALGQYEDALPRIDRAATLFAQDKNTPRAAQMRLLSGEALFLQERYAEATTHFEDALQTFRDLGLHRWEAATCVLGARIFAHQHKASTARTSDLPSTPIEDAPVEQLRACLLRLPRSIYPLQRYRVLEALGEMLQIVGPTSPPAEAHDPGESSSPDPFLAESAESVFREAISCLEDVRVRVPTEDSKIAFLQDKTHLYDRLLTIEMGRPKPEPERIFEWMERSRAQSLWDRLRSPRSYLGPEEDDNGDSSKIEETRRHLSWLHSRLSQLELGNTDERKQAVSLRTQLAETETNWQRLLRERSESEGGGSVTHPERTLGLDALRRSLPSGWGWISYHLGPDFALALVLTREATHWCPLQNDLTDRIRGLCNRLDFQWGAAALSSVRGGMATAPSQEGSWTGAPHNITFYNPVGRNVQSTPKDNDRSHQMLQTTTDVILSELYGLLWQPIEDLGIPEDLDWIISPHGPVHRVPLHALRGPEGYLVERTNLVLSPSARVWHELPAPNSLGLQKRESTTDLHDSPGRAWISGVPSKQLPAVEIEIDRVGRHLSQLEVVKDLHPTRQNFVTEAPKADLIHLAAHGSLRKDNPAFSHVELTDGPLFVHDISSLQLRPSTIVLTACSSGRGTAPAGDEWIGLARGFLQAGASTVVASLWPIQDQPTLELMDLFYGRLRAGDTVPVALGEAMRALLKTRPHPWHWASFAVLGGVSADVAIKSAEFSPDMVP